MKFTDEYINGIKMIKLNQWNKVFIEKINKIRNKELKNYMKMSICVIFIISFGYITIPLV